MQVFNFFKNEKSLPIILKLNFTLALYKLPSFVKNDKCQWEFKLYWSCAVFFYQL